jgi:hypothetical protein
MVAPPSLVGGVKLTLALALPAVALTMVGAPGTLVVVMSSLPPPQPSSPAASQLAASVVANAKWRLLLIAVVPVARTDAGQSLRAIPRAVTLWGCIKSPQFILKIHERMVAYGVWTMWSKCGVGAKMKSPLGCAPNAALPKHRHRWKAMAKYSL